MNLFDIKGCWQGPTRLKSSRGNGAACRDMPPLGDAGTARYSAGEGIALMLLLGIGAVHVTHRTV